VKMAWKRFCALCCSMVFLLCGMQNALASKTPSPTETPAPVEVSSGVLTPPEEIQKVLDIAYNEWQTLNGKTLSKCNKYTEWRGKGVSFGWCGGFITWCMIEAGIPMATLENIETAPVEGLYHVKEASVGKLLRGYLRMGRMTLVPQKGYLLVYGVRKSANKTVHIGLVYDVEELGDGKYRITTIEGNMSNRVKMYIHDYDMNAEERSLNLSVVPEDERTMEASNCLDYKIPKSDGKVFYVNCFLMPWLPEDAQ
jgi:hypothetical protein